MRHVTIGLGAASLLFGSSCAPALSPSVPAVVETRTGTSVSRSWAFPKEAASARTPVTVTLRLDGPARDAEYVWRVEATDGAGAVLFRVEGTSRELDDIFRESYSTLDCQAFLECKERWYFEEWPNLIARGFSVVDNTANADRTADYRRENLRSEASKFLRDRGASPAQQVAVIDEMLTLLAGRFDSLYLPLDPFSRQLTLMFVPSVGYFVPYWAP